MKIYKLTNEAYEQYKEGTKGNQNISKDQAARKLTRNIMLAKEVKIRNKIDRLLGKKLFHYGNMDIILQFGRIIYVENHKGGKRKMNWHKEQELYEQLTREFGIAD